MADKGKRKFDIDEAEDLDVAGLPQGLAEEQPEGEEALQPQEETRYFIDFQWYEQRELVFSTVAQARLCPSCGSKLATFVDERYPVIDPKTKRVAFEFRRVPFAANPLPIIRDCCSRSRDYITPETPLLEAIFRVFLANGNQPMTMSTVREHLLTYLPEMAALRSDYPVQLLERVVRGDSAYGLCEHRLPVSV